MEEIVTQCPFCGETITIEIEDDTEESTIQDCDVCCRPLELRVGRNENGEISLTVERAQ